VSGCINTVKTNLKSLCASPRELWLAYLLKFLESYGYFSMSVILVLYLSDEFHLSDVEAGMMYGLYGAITSGVGFLIGFVIDNLGVRLSLITGFTILSLSRFIMAVTTRLWMVKLALYVLLPIGSSLGIPVLSMGIKRYTTPQRRGFAFGIFYTVMNAAALASGLFVDCLELRLKSGFVLFGTHYSSRRLIFLSGMVASLLGLVIAFFFREIKVSDKLDDEVTTYKVERRSPWSIFREVVCLDFFWRFMGITLICINLKMIFRYLDAMLPTYLVREFGPDVPKGTIYSINPAMIIALVPLVAAFTTGVTPFTMIHIGSYISALSALPMALSTSIPSAVCFVVVLSLGEAIWSPRFYDLTVSMAPEGKEGTFLALGSAPIFAAKFPVGMLSGVLLETFCPKAGHRQSTTMWLIIFLMTMTSPILLTIFQRWLQPPVSTVKEI